MDDKVGVMIASMHFMLWLCERLWSRIEQRRLQRELERTRACVLREIVERDERDPIGFHPPR